MVLLPHSEQENRLRHAKKATAFLGTLLLSGVLALAPSTPASAVFGSLCESATECVSLGNNKYHSVQTDGSFGTNNTYDIPNMWYAVRDRLQYSFTDQTNVVAYFDQSDPYPDVRVADYNWGNNGWLGATYCPSNNTGTGGSHPYRWCRGQLIKFNAYYYWNATALQDWTVRHHVACHELGHTLGLRHNYYVGSDGTISCMHTLTEARYLRPGEINELNAHYR